MQLEADCAVLHEWLKIARMRTRAGYARQMAEDMVYPEHHDLLLEIAAQYDALADQLTAAERKH